MLRSTPPLRCFLGSLSATLALTCAAATADTGTFKAFPSDLGGLRLEEKVDFESRQPGMGSAYLYGGTQMKATVYVYDLQLRDLPEGLQSARLLAQFDQAHGDIDRTYGDTRILLPRAAGPGACQAFLRMKLSVGDRRAGSGGERLNSWLYLSSRQGKFIKARVTYPAGTGGSAGDAAQERFAQALCKFTHP